MDDFGDDLFDEFEKPSVSSFAVEEQKPDVDQENPEQKYVFYEINHANLF